MVTDRRCALMANASSNDSLSDPIGQDFGPYKLVRRLGVGGMAETFEAIRTGPGGFSQRVCVKVVLPFYRNRQDFRELFDREARLAAKLRHGNVVGVIDMGCDDEGTVYLVLERVEGRSLSDRIEAEGRLSLRASLEIVLPVLDALAAGLACRAAVKIHNPLTVPEMQRLVSELFAAEQPYACPHGRPVVLCR